MDMVARLTTALTGDATAPDLHRRVAALLRRPVVRQALLLLPLALNLAPPAAAGTLEAAGPVFLGGLMLVSLVTLVTLVHGRDQAPPGSLAALAFVDLAAIGMMRPGLEGGGLSMLALIPAVWLALDYGMRGVAATVVGIVAVVSVPAVLARGGGVVAWSGAVTVPAVAGMCAFSVAVTAAAWSRQNARLAAQQERLEEALCEVTRSRALNEAIVTTADVGLVALDRHGDYVLVNPKQRDILRQAFPHGHGGRPGLPGAVFGEDRTTLLDMEARPSYRAMCGETVADQLCWVGTEPEHQRALSISARPILDAEGRPDGAVLVYIDVTDLMSALTVKDEFVASVSHELRTPLTSILGYLELLLEDPASALDDPVRQRLDIVRRNAERLYALVKDLLLTAQLDHATLAMDLTPVELTATVAQALVDHAPRAAAAGVTVVDDLRPGLVVPGDPVRLRQLVDNLVTNGIKYTPPRGCVAVSLRPGGGGVVLEVADTGVGIAAEDLPRVFTRFYRTADARARAVQGLGLGLAITHRLVEAHGGRIEVESEPGRGSTFRVHLPACGGEPVAPAAAPAEWSGAHLP